MTRRAPADSLAALFLRPTAWQLAIAGFFVFAIIGQSALATVTDHRSYLFEGNLDDSGPDNQDLNATGTASYTAGQSGGQAILFDGNTSQEGLTGTALNAVGGSTAEGMQMWVFPANGADFNSTRQQIVYDTQNAGGPAISADGKWIMANDFHTEVGGIVDVVPGQWHHVMQHIYVDGTFGAPVAVSGGGNGFTSVLFVNGVAVAANNDSEASSPTDDNRTGALVVGAAEVPDTNASFTSIGDFFDGAVDNLEMYTDSNASFYLITNDTTDLVMSDNEYIDAQILAGTGGHTLELGDITIDGNVDQDDIDAFKAGWLSEKILVGAHNSVYVGDWETYQNGDLNLDGRVNLEDAYLLHLGLVAAAAAAEGSATATSIPEPATLATFLLGVIGLAAAGMRRRRG